MATRNTSIGSSSGAPSPPNPTPCTEAASEVDSLPGTDLNAVGQILVPIQEDLNESAEEGQYPSPPVNTPAFSPAPSVRGHGRRGRGLSGIGDRLAQLKLEDRVLPTKDDSSTQSAVPSISEEGEGNEIEDGASDGKSPDISYAQAAAALTHLIGASSTGEIPIGLGSPVINPRIEEYATFKADDLPVAVLATESKEDDEKSKESKQSQQTAIRSEGVVTEKSGVTEKSNWAEDAEDYLEGALMKLEQLAQDEFEDNPSIPAHEYYKRRLLRRINASKRKFPVNLVEKAE